MHSQAVSAEMKPDALKEVGLPSTGAVLAFMVVCLGVPKETDRYTYKELERLRKGGLATEKYWAVARKIMDAIVASFVDAKEAGQTIDTVFEQKVAAPIKCIHWRMQKGLLVPVPEFAAPREAVTWKWNAAGDLKNVREHLVQDWIEFLERHEFLVDQCGSGEKPRVDILFQWTCAFVVPFLAMILVEYRRNDSRLESGMPGGRFWYLPQLILPEATDGRTHLKWPVNFVLEWWEDLLGDDLESYAGLLCALGENPDNARRQVRAWRHENRPPDQTTIERWCKMSWVDKYAGAFADDATLPPNERWNRCRAFLVQKGLHDTTRNWLEGVRGNKRKVFQKQYRGERLELEIPPFKETSFAAFFESADPVAAGLPVRELVERIAERYASPTNDQLKARLMISAAFQRAFTQAVNSLGANNALQICDWFQQVYCFVMNLHNRANPETREEILRLLRQTSESQGGLRCACEWLFDEESWFRLPVEIEELLNS
jgi:hypothetical protein